MAIKHHPGPQLRAGHPSLIKEGIKKIQNYLQDHALDAFLVMTKLNRQYLSEFTGSAGVVLIIPSPGVGRAGERSQTRKSNLSSPSFISFTPLGEERRGGGGEKKGGAVLFVDERYLIRARRESPLQVKNIKLLPAFLRPALRPTRRIGIEDRITLRELADLKKLLPGVKFSVTKNIVENIRAVKTPQEIGYIKQAQKIVDRTFWHIKKVLQQTRSFSSPSFTSSPPLGEERWGVGEERNGVLTEGDIALEIERFAKKLGADGPAFEPIIAFGPNAAAPHHLSSKQKIRNNNFLLMDFGVLVKGYHSDFTRTLFIGHPNKKQEKVYNTVLEAQRKGIAKVRAGNVANAVDADARAHIKKQKFGKYFTHNTGHGVGLEIHELPNFSPNSDDVLQNGMIATVEPGIYIENWGGVRIEDMVQVTAEGPRILSKVSKDLKSMIIH